MAEPSRLAFKPIPALFGTAPMPQRPFLDIALLRNKEAIEEPIGKTVVKGIVAGRIVNAERFKGRRHRAHSTGQTCRFAALSGSFPAGLAVSVQLTHLEFGR